MSTCRHGTVEDLVPGAILHTHKHENIPDHTEYDRWLITGLMTNGGSLVVQWMNDPDRKIPTKWEGTIPPTDLEPRLANDYVRIEVAE